MTDALFGALESWSSRELGHFIGANRWRIEAGLASDDILLAVGCAAAVLGERKMSDQGGFMTEPSFGTAIELRAEFKAADSGWHFSGYASAFNNVDQGGDVVMPGAFRKSLRSGRKRPLLWQHDIREPIGVEISLDEDDRGLFGTWKLVDSQRGSDAHKLLREGAVNSLSIGYLPVDAERTRDGVRKLLSVDLLEVSVVSLPMNTEALITGVKHRQDVDDVHAAFRRLRIRQHVREERESERLRQRLHEAARRSYVY